MPCSKGLVPTWSGVVPARAINFFAYGNGKRLIAQNFNNGEEASWVHLLAAANAGILTGTATNPIWLVKTRLQLDKATAAKAGAGMDGRKYKNALDCTLQTVRTEGIRGLYRGLTASYLGVTESTIQWVLYEQMKRSLARREARLAASGKLPTSWDDTIAWLGKLGAAGGAKFIAALATYPHEVSADAASSSANHNGCGRQTSTQVHRACTMLQVDLERGRHGCAVRWAHATHVTRGAECCHHVWHV